MRALSYGHAHRVRPRRCSALVAPDKSDPRTHASISAVGDEAINLATTTASQLSTLRSSVATQVDRLARRTLEDGAPPTNDAIRGRRPTSRLPIRRTASSATTPTPWPHRGSGYCQRAQRVDRSPEASGSYGAGRIANSLTVWNWNACRNVTSTGGCKLTRPWIDLCWCPGRCCPATEHSGHGLEDAAGDKGVEVALNLAGYAATSAENAELDVLVVGRVGHVGAR